MPIRSQYRFCKPQLAPVLFIIAATITLGALSTWQLQRLAWKEAIIAKAEEAGALPPITTLANLPEDTSMLEYRKAEITGAFATESPLLMVASHKGVYGSNYIFPFVSEGGGLIFVNLGFVPQHMEGLIIPLHEEVTLKGMLRKPREKRFFAPANDPRKNVWFYEDIPAMQKAVGIDPMKVQFLPLILAVTEKTPGLSGTYPIAHDEKILFRNDHLGYAITWFLVMVAGLVMFAVYHLKKKESA